MKNVTVSLDDETYRRGRLRAVELDTTLSALVRDFLNGLGAAETEFERLEREEQELRMELQGRGVDAGNRLPREELYDRAARRIEWEEDLRGR